ncbi:MAG TPA: type III-A CRISPR-associated protein Csm2 [Planctomycetes bacterium]|nr:type III-A CRISPR-associated protein Csm2 [Planctomycetota bacterium]
MKDRHFPRQRSRRPSGPVEVLFDPAKPDTELFDTLAEKQAEQLEVNSSQLRRFFGEIKDLYRRFNALASGEAEQRRQEIYSTQIEPRFKMVRSKVAYATRAGGQTKLPERFAEFLKTGIQRVGNQEEFVRFIMHVEAVVGFMYGKGKVKQ